MRERDEERDEAVDQEQRDRDEEREEQLRQERLDQKAAQLQYLKGTMATAGTRAAIAFRRAGLTLSAELRAQISVFVLEPDNSFTLRLREPVKQKLGGATITFGDRITGHIGRGVTFYEGVRCAAAVEEQLREGHLKRLQPADGGYLEAETDDEMMKRFTAPPE